jgi:DNA topoisomerase I
MLHDRDDAALAIVDPRDAAESVGLVYVNDKEPGIRRRKSGRGFTYLHQGKAIKDAAALKRIMSIAIPPAWTDVWISPKPNGHIQATGRDAKGRKQYRYHAEFREVREGVKFEHLMEFARLLPKIRAKVSEHMSLPGLPREKVLATTVHLLETTLIRVGNEDYAKNNNSFGLTTLRHSHAKINGSELRFQFKGKSGKTWRIKVNDRRVAKIVKACQDLPGQELLQYVDEEGVTQDVKSTDVNDYLKEITGHEVTAKDFRTWAGTVLAALALREFQDFDGNAKAKKNVRAAIERVSSRLGNTPTICRKCYVHPEILNSYLSGSFLLEVKDEVESGLRDELADLKPETAVMTLLRGRLANVLGDDHSTKR